MAKILSPNKKFTGTSASVPFINGVGYTDNADLILWFKSKGYTVENETAEDVTHAEAEDDSPPDILDGMTVDELVAFAQENNIDIGKSTSKEGILKKIRSVACTGGDPDVNEG